MNKVVFNNCFGGFSLSVKAVEWLAENGHGKIKEKAQEYKKTSDRWARFGCHLSGLDRHDPDLVRCVETLGIYNAFVHVCPHLDNHRIQICY